MKNNKVFLLSSLIVAFVFFLALLVWTKRSTPEIATEQPKVDASLLIKAHSPIKGNADAKVTIVEFLDPECEACRAMHPILKNLMEEYKDNLRLVIRYMPFHGNSKLAAAGLEEAREQGRFDEALDILFARQPEWGDHHHPKPELIPILLAEAGVDKKTLDPSALIAKHGEKIDIDEADGKSVGVRMTPTFFVNGEIQHEIGYEPLKKAIEKALIEN